MNAFLADLPGLVHLRSSRIISEIKSDSAMQRILIIIHAAPYGSERCLSALRLAALSGRDEKPVSALTYGRR